MKTIKYFLLILFAFIGVNSAQSQQLTFEQEEMFRNKVKLLMDKYSEANQITSDFAKLDMKLVEQLRTSFVISSKKVIYNDLLPQKVEGSKYLTPTEYVQFAQRFYPEGIDVRVEVQDISINSKEQKKGGYYQAVVRARKVIRGFYGNARIHTFSDVLYFFVTGVMVEGRIEGLGISMVAEGSKFATVNASNRFGGMYVGLSGAYSYATVSSNELGESNWYAQSPDLAPKTILPAFELHYMFTKGFGFGTGIKFGNYSPTLVLDGLSGRQSFTLPDNFDTDGDRYNPEYYIDGLVEQRTIQTFDIPLLMKFRTGSKGFSLYFDMGVVYTKYRKVSNSYSGTVTRKGFYSQYNVLLERIEEYDYFDNKLFMSDDSYDIPIQNFPTHGLSGLFSIGFSIAPYKNILIKIGATTCYGFQNDVSYDQTDQSLGMPKIDFYNTTGVSMGQTLLHSISADFGIYYRILGK